MAERRMFAKTIVLSDAFLDMPLSARCLYFTLGMLADDDGFVNSPKSVMRQVGASVDDMNILLGKRFILAFDSGVIVIKHWRINNYLRSDRYTETKYIEEKRNLETDESGTYHIGIPGGIPSIGKDSVVEDSVVEDTVSPAAPTKPPKHKYGEYRNVLLTDEELQKLKEEFPVGWTERIERLSEYIASTGKVYKNHLATIRAWAKRENEKPTKRLPTDPDKSSLDVDGFEQAVRNHRPKYTKTGGN